MIATTATVKHNGHRTSDVRGHKSEGPNATASLTSELCRLTTGSTDSSVLRIVVRPYAGPRGGVDVTDTVVGAIAERLWNMFGGNDVLNWLEAERLLQDALVNIRRRDVL